MTKHNIERVSFLCDDINRV